MKVTAIIPTLNPSEQIHQVIANCLANGFEKIIVVNDGSSGDKAEIFAKIVKNKKCTVLVHDVNKGKGAALKTAFSYYLENNKEHKGVVTLDDDGQHDIKDIKKVGKCLKKNSKTLILGSRDFTKKNVPFKSKFGNQITSFMFRFLIDIKLEDTQTGLRAIPNQLLETFINVKGERFEYETNMLLECQRQSIEMVEAKIQTIYLEKNQNSHFNPFKDSLRIYRLLMSYAFEKFNQKLKTKFEPFINKTNKNRFMIQLRKATQTGYQFLIRICRIVCVLLSNIMEMLVNLRKKESQDMVQSKTTKTFKHIVSIYAIRMGIFLLSVVMTLFVFAWGSLAIVSYGPSQTARDLFVTSVMETSGVKFLASIYFSEEEINSIIENNAVVVTNEITDGETVVINPVENQDIVIEDVVGDTFIGKMMIVSDPSRIFVEDVQVYNESGEGDLLSEMIARTGAIAGINGGEFYDPGGYGQGGMPMGVVIKKGVLKNDSGNSCVIGFDYNHKLIVGNMSGSDAINLGIQEAVSFGPALIINGERAPIYGNGGGLNPRTAIGQRSDGAVLMLVIDGRQPNSLGASYKDIADVMQQYGAVNAANLDGGSSSILHYNGEMLNQISMVGVRRIPTAFLVR